MTDSEPVIQLAQGHIHVLIARNWPAISELLDESEEVNLSAKITITNRTPEDGNHGDVDHRVKTTISFSKKVSDSTESALEDPSKLPLTCPHGKTLDEYCDACAAEAKSGNVFVPPAAQVCAHGIDVLAPCPKCDQTTEEAKRANPEHHPETGDSAAETREAAAVLKDAAQPIGTSVGAALDKAAVETKAPQFLLDLNKDDWTFVGLGKAWKAAAKKADWSPAQISALADILKTSSGVNSMIETLRPFVIAAEPQEEPDTHIMVHVTESDVQRVPLLAVDLPTDFPLEKVLHTFVVAAREADWPKEAITVVGNEAERQARVIGDEPEATQQATKYLTSFCVSK